MFNHSTTDELSSRVSFRIFILGGKLTDCMAVRLGHGKGEDAGALLRRARSLKVNIRRVHTSA
jgi:hypothetical protein